MTLADHIIEIIRDECDWPLRYPPLPEITEDTFLEQNWFGPVDRACVQMRLDEEFGFELSCDEFARVESVSDIISMVKQRVGVVA
jgi:acyl carrier protein